MLIEEEKVQPEQQRRTTNSANIIEENNLEERSAQQDDWETKQKYAKSTKKTVSSMRRPSLYRRVMDNHVKPFLERRDGYETILIVSVFVILYLISYFSAN